MTAEAPVIRGRDGAVAMLRFNRPAAFNAIDLPLAEAFLAAAHEIAADKTIRAVLISGNGKGFMAGGDLATLQADPLNGAIALMEPMHTALRILAKIDAPLIAQVHGIAAGAGLSLMLQADFVLAAEGSRFNLAYVNVGTSCDLGASWALPRLIGLRRALEVALLGEWMDAETAARLGLVSRVVPAASLETEAQVFAQRLAAGPTVAMGHLRRLMRSSFDRDLDGQLEAEAAAFRDCAVHEDFKTGVDAFFARKTPQFSGR